MWHFWDVRSLVGCDFILVANLVCDTFPWAIQGICMCATKALIKDWVLLHGVVTCNGRHAMAYPIRTALHSLFSEALSVLMSKLEFMGIPFILVRVHKENIDVKINASVCRIVNFSRSYISAVIASFLL